LGLKGGVIRELEAGRVPEDLKSKEIYDAVNSLKDEYRGSEVMAPSAVYQFFKSSTRGNRVTLDGVSFEFPRQRKENGLCLADYVHPENDSVALFVVSVGKGVRELAEQLKNRGDYLKSHILQALALESAEAYAEFLHSQIRKMWGFPDPLDMTMMQRFQAKYHGKRYSFGYPACPNLEDQKQLFELLKPEEIGVQLTDGFMMDPEASVSAIVFHHPEATYFSVGSGGMDNREG
jgi:5-methyltetrahydrofolate--homocysteine methyltransferase